MRPTRPSNGTPAAANSALMLGTSLAMPAPSTSRPSLIRSSVASWCAKTTGLRNAGKKTAVPSVTRCVRAAAAASKVKRIMSWPRQ